MNEPICSVIIPTYNHAKYIDRSIQCALDQTYPHVEVVVIDDGSTDDTPERVKKYLDRIVYRRKSNAGLGAARNTGIGLSKGKYLQFLDADDTIEPEKLSTQIKLLEENGDIAVVYSDCSCTDEEGRALDNTSYPLKDEEHPLPILLKRTLFSVHAPLVRKCAIVDAGRFDESRIAQEDWQLWLKMALQGCRFRYRPGNLAHYDGVGSTMTTNSELMYKRVNHLLETFLSDSEFQKLDRRMVREFTACQNIALATRAYNNSWSRLARRHFLRAFRAKPEIMTWDYWLCIPKTYIREATNLVFGRSQSGPKG